MGDCNRLGLHAADRAKVTSVDVYMMKRIKEIKVLAPVEKLVE